MRPTLGIYTRQWFALAGRSRVGARSEDDVRRTLVAVEACTGWLFVCRALERAGAVVHLAEPMETSALRGRKRRAKTDRTDARDPALQVPGATSEIWFTSSTRAHAALAILLDRLFDPPMLQLFLRARRFPDLEDPSCRLRHACLEPQARRRLALLALHVQPESRVVRVVLVTVDTVEIKHESLANPAGLLLSAPQEL